MYNYHYDWQILAYLIVFLSSLHIVGKVATTYLNIKKVGYPIFYGLLIFFSIFAAVTIPFQLMHGSSQIYFVTICIVIFILIPAMIWKMNQINISKNNYENGKLIDFKAYKNKKFMINLIIFIAIMTILYYMAVNNTWRTYSQYSSRYDSAGAEWFGGVIRDDFHYQAVAAQLFENSNMLVTGGSEYTYVNARGMFPGQINFSVSHLIIIWESFWAVFAKIIGVPPIYFARTYSPLIVFAFSFITFAELVYKFTNKKKFLFMFILLFAIILNQSIYSLRLIGASWFQGNFTYFVTSGLTLMIYPVIKSKDSIRNKILLITMFIVNSVAFTPVGFETMIFILIPIVTLLTVEALKKPILRFLEKSNSKKSDWNPKIVIILQVIIFAIIYSVLNNIAYAIMSRQITANETSRAGEFAITSVFLADPLTKTWINISLFVLALIFGVLIGNSSKIKNSKFNNLIGLSIIIATLVITTQFIYNKNAILSFWGVEKSALFSPIFNFANNNLASSPDWYQFGFVHGRTVVAINYLIILFVAVSVLTITDYAINFVTKKAKFKTELSRQVILAGIIGMIGLVLAVNIMGDEKYLVQFVIILTLISIILLNLNSEENFKKFLSSLTALAIISIIAVSSSANLSKNGVIDSTITRYFEYQPGGSTKYPNQPLSQKYNINPIITGIKEDAIPENSGLVCYENAISPTRSMAQQPINEPITRDVDMNDLFEVGSSIKPNLIVAPCPAVQYIEDSRNAKLNIFVNNKQNESQKENTTYGEVDYLVTRDPVRVNLIIQRTNGKYQLVKEIGPYETRSILANSKKPVVTKFNIYVLKKVK
jgi:hypothetical protein